MCRHLRNIFTRGSSWCSLVLHYRGSPRSTVAGRTIPIRNNGNSEEKTVAKATEAGTTAATKVAASSARSAAPAVELTAMDIVRTTILTVSGTSFPKCLRLQPMLHHRRRLAYRVFTPTQASQPQGMLARVNSFPPGGRTPTSKHIPRTAVS